MSTSNTRLSSISFQPGRVKQNVRRRTPFTIMTMRTPASFLEATQGIRLRFPVILMDGAVIYDPLKTVILINVKCPMDRHQKSCMRCNP